MNWFIAFPLSLTGFQLPPPPPKVRAFSASDLHVTVAFLGAVKEQHARAAFAMAAKLAKSVAVPKSVTFADVEALGHKAKPSALAALIGDGRQELEAAITAVRGPTLRFAGIEQDDRPALAHVTFARPARRASDDEREAALRWARSIAVGTWRATVGKLALFTWADDREEALFKIAAVAQ